ncbi:hypothetical protein T4B_12349 [Trichinella pseudospiralis]|uniref:Uncharacterized protein n=1 Tax=Trichinella pseudospiralis TaxID=6337 RepID=A0A0V1G890_TRIPS|nr:hypothetical protein T4B_12349 [Trichinella pseudospiralis]KRY95458.1 hypothetical protein T4C_5586 [Trichinella pseudospiralis]
MPVFSALLLKIHDPLNTTSLYVVMMELFYKASKCLRRID